MILYERFPAALSTSRLVKGESFEAVYEAVLWKMKIVSPYLFAGNRSPKLL